jgi:hypothetical protein
LLQLLLQQEQQRRHHQQCRLLCRHHQTAAQGCCLRRCQCCFGGCLRCCCCSCYARPAPALVATQPQQLLQLAPWLRVQHPHQQLQLLLQQLRPARWHCYP